jgi:hypothetical protein
VYATLCKKTLARARPVIALVSSNVAATKLFTEMYAQKMSEIEAAVRALPSGRHFGTTEDSVAELSFVAPDSKSRSNKRTRSGYEAESSQKKTAIKVQSTRMLTWTHQGIFTYAILCWLMFQKQKIREMHRLHRANINKAESSCSDFEQDVSLCHPTRDTRLRHTETSQAAASRVEPARIACLGKVKSKGSRPTGTKGVQTKRNQWVNTSWGPCVLKCRATKGWNCDFQDEYGKWATWNVETKDFRPW